MLPEIETLLIIQDKDRRIHTLRKDQANRPILEEQARQKLASDEKAVADCKAAIQGNEVQIKNLELDVQTRRDTIGKLKTQQFETRKNEEYRALGQEVERYEKEVTELEDRELEFMETAEQLKADLKTAQEAHAGTQAVVDADLKTLAERFENAEKEIELLAGERAELVPRIDPSLMSIYDRLFKSKHGTAVVPLLGGQCKGCHMKVTATIVLKVKTEKEVVHCAQCGRLLYYEG